MTNRTHNGHLRLIVEDRFSGIRLDHYINTHFESFSRERIRRMIRCGDVRVNDSPALTYSRLRAGDIVEFAPPGSRIVPQDLPLDIIYEDNDIITVNKQAGMMVHPARGQNTDTLANALACRGGCFEYGIVHRLDRDTSGVIVLAKNPRANTILSKQFANRRVEKGYLAIVHGMPQPAAGQIELPIGADPKFPDRYTVCPDGKYSLTLYDTVLHGGGVSLLKVQIKTGRTHQIRVHLAHIGCPIIGDTVYGRHTETLISRCALHASSLKLRHPSTGRHLIIQADMPEDMKKVRMGLINSDK